MHTYASHLQCVIWMYSGVTGMFHQLAFSNPLFLQGKFTFRHVKKKESQVCGDASVAYPRGEVRQVQGSDGQEHGGGCADANYSNEIRAGGVSIAIITQQLRISSRRQIKRGGDGEEKRKKGGK